MDIKEILEKCDHTLLRVDCTSQEIRNLCDQAIKYHCASVCIPPCHVAGAKRYVGDKLTLCTVIGFPLGTTTPESKVFEALQAVKSGAVEIDAVINVCALKSGNTRLLEQELQALAAVAEGEAKLKIILETCLLTREEIVLACQLAKAAGADFVKTSTGFSKGGATVEDVALMRETVGPDMGVKASGGIRDLASARAMLAAGADRIGTSAGVKIVLEEQAEG